MTHVPTVVGINRTQNGSIAVARGDGHMVSLQKERVTRRPHHWGRRGDLRDLYRPRLRALSEPVDLVVECYSSDPEVAHEADYFDEMMDTITFREGPRATRISHHLAHLYSALAPSPFDEAAVMVIDARGSAVRDLTDRLPPGASVAPDLVEVASFYRCAGGRIECLGKQLWSGDWDHPAGLGCFYSKLTRTIFPGGEGSEGKVMGLAPFGKPGSMGLPPLAVDGHRVLIPEEWLEVLAERECFRYGADGVPFQRAADLAAEGQRAFEEALGDVTMWLHARSGMTNLCFAGGTALNWSANGRLLREGPFDELFIPPSAHAGGTAVGCALYGLIECLRAGGGFRWVDDFLGPEPDPAATAAAIRGHADGLVVEVPPDLAGRVVELLADGLVVGLCQGRSESGPRALGNRSILADARHPDMKDFINARVKRREWFRPLAPLVLADHAAEIFDVDRPAPFMQHTADVRPEYRALLPAVTQVDGTARLQTVEPGRTPFLHALLDRFATETGCPVLVNTSLAGPGDPIVETADEALACLTSTAMHALVMPPYLVRKPSTRPRPGGD